MLVRSSVRKQDFHPETQAFFAGRRVLVLGGSGFIGSHVVEQLLDLGSHPIVLSRSSSPEFLAHLSGEIELIEGSLYNEDCTLAAMRRASVVLNLAATVAGIKWNAAHPASMFMDNMALFFSALRGAAKARVDRFLITSSACVYPRFCSIPTPEEEGFQEQPEPTNAGYGWAKRMEEFLGTAAVQEYGLSVAIARPYNAYGPRDDFDPETSHVLAALIKKAVEASGGTFPVWGDGSHSRSFLYVGDFARGLLEVAARFPVAEPVNIGSDEETTIRAAAEMIAHHVSAVMKKTVRPVFDPSEITGQPRRCCDTRKMRAVLGYEPKVTLNEGLLQTILWYVDHEHCSLHSHT